VVYQNVTTNTVVGDFQLEQQRTGLMRTNIATHHFTNFERLIYAIMDDDVATIDRLGIPLEELASLEFEGNANILNFAIEQERISIVLHLADLTNNRPEVRRKLLEHRFR